MSEQFQSTYRKFYFTKKEPFITLKDHKPNIDTDPKCRLTNPTKTEIGRVSKQTLDRINKQVLAIKNTNLWKNTKEILDWFNPRSLLEKIVTRSLERGVGQSDPPPLLRSTQFIRLT